MVGRIVTRSNSFESSDEEGVQEESTPLHIDWVDIPGLAISNSLGFTNLPGCIFRGTHRSLENDIAFLEQSLIQDVFVFCTNEELRRYHVPTLLQTYSDTGFNVHHFPFTHGDVPSKEQTVTILQELTTCFYNQRKILLHCNEGLDRSCLVIALFMLAFQQNALPDELIERLKQIKGSSAIQTVKQYNFIHEFKDLARQEGLDESLRLFRNSVNVQIGKERRLSR